MKQTPTTSLHSSLVHELNQSDVQQTKQVRCKDCFARPLEECHDCDGGQITRPIEQDPHTEQAL